jgi:hypothetical protein
MSYIDRCVIIQQKLSLQRVVILGSNTEVWGQAPSTLAYRSGGSGFESCSWLEFFLRFSSTVSFNCFTALIGECRTSVRTSSLDGVLLLDSKIVFRFCSYVIDTTRTDENRQSLCSDLTLRMICSKLLEVLWLFRSNNV